MIFNEVYTLDLKETKAIYIGWISDKDKMEQMAKWDGRTPEEVARDVVSGLIGEWNGYHFIRDYGTDCKLPECGKIERDASIWGKDLITLESVQIYSANGTKRTVDNSMTCKGQFLSRTKCLGLSEPTWTFQLPTSDRPGDPILKNATANKLFVASWIYDYWFSPLLGKTTIRYIDPKVACKHGFRFRSQVGCFWWPDVYPYLSASIREDLRSKKKCLYFSDIKHLQARIIRK
jgi:hypothetical protein